jgi:hypothetical protein
MELENRHLSLELPERKDIEEVVIAFRKDGELYELTSIEPPVEANIAQQQPRD